MNGEFEAIEKMMKLYVQKVNNESYKFQIFKIAQVLREENSHADSLANLASTSIILLNRTLHSC